MKKKSLFSRLLSGITDKWNKTLQKQTAEEAPRPEAPSLKFVFFIVDWNRVHVISRVFEEEKVRFHFVSKGRGTANSEVLDLLGIGARDKAIITCLEQTVFIPVLLKEVRKKLGFHSPGAGIAFTVSLSAINDPVLLVFKQSIHKNEKIAVEQALKTSGKAPKGKGEIMGSEHAHDLIVCIVNQGYSDELMVTARNAGASGGTIINARGQAHEGAVKFFGVSVQDEKEMLIILTNREKKVPIMSAVCAAHGLNSKAQGIVFSLPVDDVLGLSFE